MHTIILQFFRGITGILFVFSGFVKLVDPQGSAYKFEEYFGGDVLNLEGLIPFALPFSIVLILTELILGIALLLGYRTKTTLWCLFGITTLFLCLTGYSAIFDKVTDCGCFGDAIKLTAWETFYKNIIFLMLIVWMMIKHDQIKPLFSKNITQPILIASVFSSLYVIYHVLTYLPLIDFRPYAIGKNIRAGMVYQEDGEIPPVHDFYLESETDDLTDVILDAPKAILMVANHLEHVDGEAWKELIKLSNKATDKGYLVYLLSSSSTALVSKTKEENTLPFDVLFCDGTTLKTMIRANPGILGLHQGTVVFKENWKNIKEIKW